MSKTYGYCRISTPKQSIDRQVRNIKAAYPAAIIVQETYTGTKTNGRKEWERLAKRLREGDMLVFDSVSRMSRNALEGFSLYKALYESGVALVFLKEPHINTETFKAAMERQVSTSVSSGDGATDELIIAVTQAINRYMLRLAERQIQLAFDQAEKEVQDLHQRTKEGIESARLRGAQIGRPRGQARDTAKAQSAKRVIQSHSKAFDGTLNDEECIKLASVSPNTYYKYKRELRSAQEG